MSTKSESKHERFLRLMQRRLERSLEELRLVSQLAKRDYTYYPEEAEEVVWHLDKAVRHVAEVFGVEYATRIGKAVSQTMNGARAIGGTFQRAPVLDEIGCVKVLEHIRAGRYIEAENMLRTSILGGERAA